jgi:hypothetical protein
MYSAIGGPARPPSASPRARHGHSNTGVQKATSSIRFGLFSFDANAHIRICFIFTYRALLFRIQMQILQSCLLFYECDARRLSSPFPQQPAPLRASDSAHPPSCGATIVSSAAHTSGAGERQLRANSAIRSRQWVP